VFANNSPGNRSDQKINFDALKTCSDFVDILPNKLFHHRWLGKRMPSGKITKLATHNL